MQTTQNPLKAGFKQAGKITKTYAKTFYFVSHFLPPEKRKATYAVYALCRISDESVDSKNNISLEKELAKTKAKLDLAYSDARITDNLLLAFRQTINKYRIPQRYFNELLYGMDMDLHKKRYRDFNELYNYCYKVAGVVGLIMLQIFEYNDAQAKKYAVDLGVAMQLTNILRDIKEDFLRERIYLPQDEMHRFGLAEKHIADAIIGNNFIAFLKFQIKRAREYYACSANGLNLIADRSCRFVVLAMQDIYSGILDAIEKNAYDVFSQRAHVTSTAKLLRTIKILWQGKFR